MYAFVGQSSDYFRPGSNETRFRNHSLLEQQRNRRLLETRVLSERFFPPSEVIRSLPFRTTLAGSLRPLASETMRASE